MILLFVEVLGVVVMKILVVLCIGDNSMWLFWCSVLVGLCVCGGWLFYSSLVLIIVCCIDVCFVLILSWMSVLCVVNRLCCLLM